MMLGSRSADKWIVFICPKCNVEVPDPGLAPPLPRWRRPNGLPARHIPICPSGHKLRTVIGYTTELPLPLAFLRGLACSSTLLLLGLIQNESPRAAVPPQAWLMFNTAFLFLIGMIAFGYAWTWAGMEGPVHRLTSRACGVALGYLVPAVISSHALYFHWANPAAVALQGQLKKLLSALVDLPNLRV